MRFSLLSTVKAVIDSYRKTFRTKVNNWLKAGNKSIMKDYVEELKNAKGVVTTEKGLSVSTKGLSLDELNDLLDVMRDVNRQQSQAQFERESRKLGVSPDYLVRAIEDFSTRKNGVYKEWVESEVVKKGAIQSKGDTLAEMFKKVLADYEGKEYTQFEVEKIFKNDPMGKF